MSKKYKKHGYAERLKYMHMLENGCSKNYIHTHYGIDDALLGHLWTRYQSEGPSGLLKKRNVKADYAGAQIPDAFVVGYGLDYAQKYRNLPYIGVVEFED